MFSPNMLKTFESCPQKYWFKYVQKISVPQKSSMFEKGKKIHALAHYYLRGDDITKLEKALNSEEKQVWESLKQNEYFQKSYVNSEYNLSCKVGDYWVGGRLDALVKDITHPLPLPLANDTQSFARQSPKGRGNDIYYILDYKTGQIPKNPEYDFQTAVYLLCVSKKFGKNVKFVYIDLKNNQNCVVDFDKDYEPLIIDICDKISNFKPQEDIEHSKKCEFCEYRKICF